MGLRYRGRSRGKDAWLNWSWSAKNGFGLSASVKSGPFTFNTGNNKSTKPRLTTNLPGGVYHVADLSTKPRPTRDDNPPTLPSLTSWKILDACAFVWYSFLWVYVAIIYTCYALLWILGGLIFICMMLSLFIKV